MFGIRLGAALALIAFASLAACGSTTRHERVNNPEFRDISSYQGAHRTPHIYAGPVCPLAALDQNFGLAGFAGLAGTLLPIVVESGLTAAFSQLRKLNSEHTTTVSATIGTVLQSPGLEPSPTTCVAVYIGPVEPNSAAFSTLNLTGGMNYANPGDPMALSSDTAQQTQVIALSALGRFLGIRPTARPTFYAEVEIIRSPDHDNVVTYKPRTLIYDRMFADSSAAYADELAVSIGLSSAGRPVGEVTTTEFKLQQIETPIWLGPFDFHGVRSPWQKLDFELHSSAGQDTQEAASSFLYGIKTGNGRLIGSSPVNVLVSITETVKPTGFFADLVDAFADNEADVQAALKPYLDSLKPETDEGRRARIENEFEARKDAAEAERKYLDALEQYSSVLAQYRDEVDNGTLSERGRAALVSAWNDLNDPWFEHAKQRALAGLPAPASLPKRP